MRKQNGQIIRMGDRWHVRYWERRNVAGKLERKRVTHPLGPVMTRGKRPHADIKAEAERHMATVKTPASSRPSVPSLSRTSWSAFTCPGSSNSSGLRRRRDTGTYGKITLSRCAGRSG